MDTNVFIGNLEYDLSHRNSMTFNDAKSLCVDGWRIPKIEELAELGKKLYVKGNKVFLGGRHFSPRLYWTPGMVKTHRGGEIDESQDGSALFYFDLNCGWFISHHEDKHFLILVRDSKIEK